MVILLLFLWILNFNSEVVVGFGFSSKNARFRCNSKTFMQLESQLFAKEMNFLHPNDVILCTSNPNKENENLGLDISLQLGLHFDMNLNNLITHNTIDCSLSLIRDTSQPFIHMINLCAKTPEQLEKIRVIIERVRMFTLNY